MSIDTVVLDIEGTICPISYVKEILFPYFVAKLPSCLDSIEFPLDKASNDLVVKTLTQLSPDITTSAKSTFDYLKKLVDNDVKDPVLKSLQGLVWKQGYLSGELKSPIYKDSIEFIQDFPNTSQKKIYIYSSGSINAQKLLFSHVDNGDNTIDLNPQLSGYFDITTAGFKQEPCSYSKIIEKINKRGKQSSILFLSDNINEVKAAIQAGMQSFIVVRDGNAPIPENELSSHKVIHSLAQLDL
ncbi:UTR4 [Candida oxycetoniae]|uniref:Enolase-phosphatase E1 n=1 Tax=Candida oxycetoniae TaxID=497107 RepID=A0AAI9SZQ4_9ASCO|nr:UTR4 [Candida oxycetoniae]KAI3405762.2 UTR4 [Candida oxycetoniae]